MGIARVVMPTPAPDIWFNLHGGRSHKPMPVSPVVVITARGNLISAHLMTTAEIDAFIVHLKAELEKAAAAAKRALAAAA